MKIQDLSKELSQEERAVRGGAGNIAIGPQYASNSVGGGFDFGPISQTNVQLGANVTYAPQTENLETFTMTKNLVADESLASLK